jgi:hypothetical protein
MIGGRCLFMLTCAWVLSACHITTEKNAPISPKYAVRDDASPECVAVARRASFWCVPTNAVNTDSVYRLNCTHALWDYERECR